MKYIGIFLKGRLMKKCVVLGCMAVAFTCAMERNNNVFNCKGTSIIVTKGSIIERDKKVDAIMVGRNAQEKLQQDGKWVPTLYGIQERDHLYIKNKNTEMVVQECKPYTSIDDKQWKNACAKKMKSKIITISEPCIRKSMYRYDEKKEIFLQHYVYACEKGRSSCEMSGDEALQEASKDLYACYKIGLREVFARLGNKENKKIICLPLSIHVGFPLLQAAAITKRALFDFIQENTGAYKSIKLCVENQAEFDAYVNELKNLVLMD